MNPQTISVQNTLDLTTQLWRIVRSANRSEIKSVHALISKMTGSQTAAVMSLKLLYWFPRATKADGWVYKSWRDWKAECDLSQSQVKRVHAAGCLEQIGIERKVMKANGSPTMHYRINVQYFLCCVADFLDVPTTQVRAWIQPDLTPDSAPVEEPDSDQTIGRNQPIPDGPNDQTKVAETAKTITGIYQQDLPPQYEQTTQQQTVVVEQVDNEIDRSKLQRELEAIGICKSKAGFLVSRYAQERLREVLEHALSSSVSNPAGFVVQALRQSWHLRATFQERQDSGSEDPMAYVRGKFAAYINS